MKHKPWYLSKTIWTNAITLILAITGALTPDILNQCGITSKQFLGGLAFVSAALNTILRFNTDQGIAPLSSGRK